jgi:UDP-N-acetylglucosamine:LPS N-acetylglucosamine transferase
VSRLRGERVYWCYQPTNRNATNLIRNTLLAFRVLRRERPQLVVSSGAGVAVAFAYVAWLLRIKFVFIEVVDRVSSATLTGRLVRPVADLIIVQWPEQQRLYPGSKVVGRLL